MTTRGYLGLVEEKIRQCFVELFSYKYKTDTLEVIQVWYCKTVQNHKGLFIVRNKNTNIIYPQFIEATYNGDVKELYLDFYEKQYKRTVKTED